MFNVKLNLLDNTIKVFSNNTLVFENHKFIQPVVDYWYNFQYNNIYYSLQLMYDFEENNIFIGLWNISKHADNTSVENQEIFESEIIF